MPKVLVVGENSFLAQSFKSFLKVETCDLSDFSFISHNEADNVDIPSFDTVVNFAIHPDYKSQKYRNEIDFDVSLAKKMSGIKSCYIFISSRMVYSQKNLWGVREEDCLESSTPYGMNKIITETKLKGVFGSRLTVLRLANIFGHEYLYPRDSFFGVALKNLKNFGRIHFNIDLLTKKDFLPDWCFSRALYVVIKKKYSGTLNIGLGAPLSVNEVSQWLLDGYGSGQLTSTVTREDRDYYLNVDKLKSCIGVHFDIDDVKRYCYEIGQKLKKH